MMTRLDCTVRFLTQAFLGDAEQTGRWQRVAGSMTKTNSSKRPLP